MPLDRARRVASKVRSAYLTEGWPGVVRKARHKLRRTPPLVGTRLPMTPVPAPRAWPLQVLAVVERSLPQCYHYRVEQKRHILAGLGVGFTDVAPSDPDLLSHLQLAHLLIVYRLPDEPNVTAAVAEARRLGIPVVFEVDDVVYRRELAETNPNLRTLPRNLRAAVIQGTSGYRAALESADFNLAATAALVADMQEVNGSHGFVVENGIDDQMREIAAALREQPPDPMLSDHCVVTYGSGSRAHDHDFAEAAVGLARWMHQQPDALLKVIGPVAIPAALTGLTDRIVRIQEPLDYPEYLRELHNSTISLAPLTGDRFNRFKSQVKYLESALVGVPLIASPTVYGDYLQHGRTGYIAASDDDWHEALRLLSRDAQLRHQISRAAAEQVHVWHLQQRPTQQMSDLLRQACGWERAS